MFARFILQMMAGLVLAAGVAGAQGPGELPDSPGATGQSEAVGSVRGRVTDSNGAPVADAEVRLISEEDSRSERTAVSQEDGRFSLAGVPEGRYRVLVSAAGFAEGKAACVLGRGGELEIEAIQLRAAATTTNVQVNATREEVSAAQVAEEETQRVLGVFPNFYVAYTWDAAPMTTRQKFGMAWRTSVDPITFGLTGAVAGIEQAQNDFSGFGQGAAAYAKRFGAVFADGTISTFLSGAVLPTVFRQDPRYFYKGTGTVKGRAWYAVTAAVVCRGDSGRREVNYSAVLGNLATGAISNLYYPAANRNGAGLTFENGLLGTAGSAVGNLIEEFLLRKVTPHVGGSTKP